ncbi:MAG: CRISPR-associated protein Cas4 [Theionarchaea archaeon]|nr:CRISPR-associated protein Cas4 [Theionarchaea archaeon]
MLTKESTITGVQVNYYFICKSKLWLFSHYSAMEHTSDAVFMGKLLHQTSYKREKEMRIGPINVDFIEEGKGVVLHEVKRSRKMEKSHIYQLLYYLYYLKQKGIVATGVINYPLLRKREKIVLESSQEEEIEGILKDIVQVVSAGTPPSPEKKPYCKKCSYYELCWVM